VTPFSVQLDFAYATNAALSCDKRRLAIFPNTIVDLESQKTIATLTPLPSLVSGQVAASPLNPNIFLSLSDKIRVVDIRVAAVNGVFEPVQTVGLELLSWYLNGASLHMKDDHTVWAGHDSLIHVDLRGGSAQRYCPFGRRAQGAVRNVLVDPVECRSIEFRYIEGLHPVISCSDLSGEEWTHTFHSAHTAASAMRASLNATQLIYLIEPHIYVYDL
jgi:hypothetical protein